MGGRRRDVEFGGSSTVTLADARDKAHELRRLAKSGQDPVVVRPALRDGVPKFEDCARKVRKATWRNGKHQAQWIKTLELYAFPTIGQLPINRIGTAEVLKLLLPIWSAKPEARRVLQRVSTIIDYGTAACMRSGENPCRLAILSLLKQTDEIDHFAALRYAQGLEGCTGGSAVWRIMLKRGRAFARPWRERRSFFARIKVPPGALEGRGKSSIPEVVVRELLKSDYFALLQGNVYDTSAPACGDDREGS